MPSVCHAVLTYVGLVLGAGFLLGVLRVLFVVPRLGERWAELAEMPVMGAVIFFAAGYLLRRFPSIRSAAMAWAVGVLALVLSVMAELALAMAIQPGTLADYLASRDRISGSVYLGMLLLFAVMPRLRLARHGTRVET